MEFFTSAVDVLKILVIALGAGLGIWGAINLLEGYGNDNPGAKSQGMKQLMAGGGVALIGTTLVPLLANPFSCYRRKLRQAAKAACYISTINCNVRKEMKNGKKKEIVSDESADRIITESGNGNKH